MNPQAHSSALPQAAPALERYDASQRFGLAVAARDGNIGKVHDLYFHDDAWAVRYIVVDTGGWLTGRRVLASPHAARRVDIGDRLHVDLTHEQVEQSPDFDSDKPVSRQYEVSYDAYYGYPNDWIGPYAWGLSLYPGPIAQPPGKGAAANAVDARLAQERERADPHLRSAKEVRDGGLGDIESFLVDARSW